MAFMLVPGFSAIAFFAALEPLRIANRLAAQPLYRWTIHAPGVDHALASNGMQLRIDGAVPARPDALIVCAGFDPLENIRLGLLGQVRRLWRAGCRIGAIDTGAFVLAEAGILGRETITLHWEAADEFRQRYPLIPVSTELYERHARLFTCAGGAAAIDMMLDGIAQDHGMALANAVSQQLIHDSIRPSRAPQRATLTERAGEAGVTVQRLIAAMERSRGQPVPLDSLLASEGIGRRSAERMFRARLGTSPGRFLRDLRLRHAVELMRNARMPAHKAALAAGFSSQPVFSRACRQHFGLSPRELLAGPGLPQADPFAPPRASTRRREANSPRST